jgi:hypothetical protein
LVEALRGPTWPNLVEASWRSCGRLGIAQGTWGRACQQFGRERAALSVLLIDRNFELPAGHRYRVLSPGRCLAGMTRRARAASINLAGLFRATKREAQQATRCGAMPSETSPPPELPLGPMTDLTARLMASFEKRVIVEEHHGHTDGYGFQQAIQMPHVVLAPSRIAAQVVSCIGFLGAVRSFCAQIRFAG